VESKIHLLSIDLVNANGISVFMFTDDFGYKQLHESMKHYSVQQHVINTKAVKYQDINHWKQRISNNLIALIFAIIMEHYWKTGINFSVVDVGANYGHFSLILGKYIKASGHSNKIYGFDCGNAGKLSGYNIKLNRLDDIIKFEYKAVSNSSVPHLVYYDPQHSADNHIVRRDFVNLSSYVVDGITLDDYFLKNEGRDNINNNYNENLIIKIDAQGVEPLIFEGMQKLLEGKHPPAKFLNLSRLYVNPLRSRFNFSMACLKDMFSVT